jgi:hypothetical protein
MKKIFSTATLFILAILYSQMGFAQNNQEDTIELSSFDGSYTVRGRVHNPFVQATIDNTVVLRSKDQRLGQASEIAIVESSAEGLLVCKGFYSHAIEEKFSNVSIQIESQVRCEDGSEYTQKLSVDKMDLAELFGGLPIQGEVETSLIPVEGYKLPVTIKKVSKPSLE